MAKKPRLKVPEYAKRAAKRALEKRARLPDSEKFGMSKKEARKKGITSGVARAEQLIGQNSVSFQDAQDIASFYARFKGCMTEKCEGAIGLWGGRKFGKKAVEFVEENEKKN